MRRREFIAGLGTVLISPLVGLRATSAQQPLLPVIGYLDLGTPEGREGSLAALSRGLADLGFFEGRNVRIHYRSAEQQPDRLPELAAEMVREPVTVIAATGGSVSALAAKAATKTIPIVFVNGGDPVANGLVSSLNRPGANVTGISFLTGELSGKRLDILRELVPGAATIAYFDAPGIGPGVSDTIAAAHTLGRQLIVLRVASAADISAAFATAIERGAGMLILSPSPLFSSNRKKIVTLAAERKVPVMSYERTFVDEGGLVSYGASVADAYRLAGSYVGRILNGEKPADLPVQQSTKIELIINTKTAKALGLTIPITLLGRADEVIE